MQKFHAKVTVAALTTLVLSACTSGPSSQAASGLSGYSGGQGPLAARTLAERPSSPIAERGQQGTSQQSVTAPYTTSPPSSPGSAQGMDHPSMGAKKSMEHASMAGMKGMDHASMPDSHNMDHSQHGGGGQGDGGGHGISTAGKPAAAANATRTVNVDALDTMRFEPSTLRVRAGEIVRFVVTNKGKVPHEFVIGTAQEQKQHEEMMQKMPGMKHEDANSISLAPGETKTLIWQFGQSNDVQIGCHVPGHYPAGMLSKVTVSTSGM